MPPRLFDYEAGWQLFIAGKRVSEIAGHCCVDKTVVRRAFLRYWPDEYKRLSVMRNARISDDVVQAAWQRYQDEEITIKALALELCVAHQTLAALLRKIPGFTNFADRRVREFSKAYTPRLHSDAAHKKAVASHIALWLNDNVEKVKTSLRHKHREDLRFRNEVTNEEIQTLVAEFRSFMPIIHIMQAHNLGQRITTKLLKSVIAKDEYEQIIFEIRRRANFARRSEHNKIALTINKGKRYGQPGNKRSRNLGSRSINHSMSVVK